MSDLDDDYDDHLNDNAFLAAEASEATAESNENTPRAAKRRCLEPEDYGQDGESVGSQTDSFRYSGDDNKDKYASDSFVDDDEVHSPSAYGEFDGDSRRKLKAFYPKHSVMQENIFVTQLTQPPSPPERIRGPRWKKPDPKPPTPKPPTTTPLPSVRDERSGGGRVDKPTGNGGRGGDNEFSDDEGLDAAIAASLESFEEENSRAATSSFSHEPAQPQPTTAAASSGKNSNNNNVSTDSFLDDIPEDAFDSEPSLSPPPRTNQAAQRTQTWPSMGRPSNGPTGLRQTTLFSMAARNAEGPAPRGGQNLSPPSKEEPPTHHKLNDDATATWVYPMNLGKTRDYQFNITQHGLFHNLLVALPTGLGKTFIAATIMLNWFRWTKSAQIVFVAPTKPLVAQQISACFGVAGIPRSQTTMLTGEAAPGIRSEEWKTKRVFFMTPQTLVNDLKTGIADPKRIVLLVVDEAHRATGGYAYVEVASFLRRFNKSFRVLALTATPGSTVESVQAVIDGLDIARVEIRTEQSLDIREYVHSKDIETQTFENSEEMVLCMDLFSRTLQPLVDQLRNLNAYWGRDPMMLTAFGLTKARQQWMASDAGRNANMGMKAKTNTIFTVLASLAHAIDLLKYHGITPFYRHLLHFQSSVDGKKGGKYQRQIFQDDHYKKLMNHLDPWVKNPEFIGHPKLEYLKQVILNHFMDAGEGDEGSSQSATKVMIFVHFRDSAEEVTRVLKRYEPMIRPHIFVGQSSAKGSDGMNQKTQLGVVEKFKKGTYNTMVATSIGEEGLDIGEVDLIVCYDSSASPIRMLQRMGRTGRKRSGNIVLLLMQGKEEESYIRAKDNYEKMQQMIASGTRFTFHDEASPRILPAGVKPVPDKIQIDIPDENAEQDLPEPKKGKGRAPKRPPKKFHMPDDVETGFTKASSLAGNTKSKGDNKSKRRVRTPTPELVELPALDEVLLTSPQQRELENRYQNIGGTSPQFIRYPRNDAFPHLQHVSRPTKSVKHGRVTRRMIGTLRNMGKVNADCEKRYKHILSLVPKPPPKRSSPVSEATRQKPSDRRPTNHFKRSKPNLPSIELDGELDLNDEPPSPAVLFSFLEDHQEPPKASQMSDLDSNYDFPDLKTLFEQADVESQPMRKRRKVMDDDSDE
ncbi:3'-5' DNA helicase [Aspergillus ruber CBS 135680]|uniref:ATP-dependent DNA helicase n=1 Tax=Aspergillus ruber (strain CBS 135680) TaxID=1388766 RepID=A0A017SBP4_ASPRC|nr:helicase C-terminal domain protein [Aspergillus ruber CBS 135680]EYE93615.1 helicase C-terminal domain protein [Aspergillus ruber CBS 135680]